MKRYEKYKKTPEAVWYKKLPINWQSLKLRAIFSERTTKVSDKEYPPLSVGKMGVVPQLETACKTDNGDNRKLIVKGDFAINSRSDRKGSGGLSNYTGSTSVITTVITPRNNVNGHYIHYLLRTIDFSEEYYRNGHGIVADLWTTKYEDMRNIYLPVPPRAEQDQIVRYLDWKVSRINKLIHAYQREIKLLEERKLVVINNAVTKGLDPNVEMKDSSVSWIGEIPKGWEVRRLRFLCKITTGNQDTQDAVIDGIYPFYVRSPIIEHSNKYTFEGEGIIIAGDGAGAGRVFHYANNKYAVHQRCYRLYDFININTCYLYYYISNQFPKIMDMGSAQSTVPSIRLHMLTDFIITIPNIDEQQAIVTYLDAKCAQIETLKSKTHRKIELLTEYRTRLISDVVTGQIDVRDVVIPNYEVEEEVIEADDEGHGEEVCDGDEC